MDAPRLPVDVLQLKGPTSPLVDPGTAIASAVLVCSYEAYALVWTAILTIHILIGVSLSVVASAVGMTVLGLGDVRPHFIDEMLAIGVELKASTLLALALLNSGISNCHFIGAVRMIYRSIRASRLTFDADNDQRSSYSKPHRQQSRWRRVLTTPFRAISVWGRYFEAAFVMRELLEVVSQSFLCFWIGKFLFRVWLNRLAVALLVLNCWSTPLLHLMAERRHMHLMTVRAYCLAIDMVLDVLMASLLPLLVVLPYFFNIVGGTYETPVWIVQLKCELQLLLPSSWLALAAQVLPMLSKVQALADIKSLTRPSSSPQAKHTALVVVPHGEGPRVVPASLPSAPPNHVRSRRMKALDVAFVVWGAIMLAMSCNGYSHHDIERVDIICRSQRHPWFAKLITCEVVVIDCHRCGISGSASEISALLTPLALNEIGALTFANCRALEMPETVNQMPSLLEIMVYNSTLVAWSENAAIRGRSHPFFFQFDLYLVNLDAVGNTLPPGLISNDDPPPLRGLAIGGTNLSQLAANTTVPWQHTFEYLALERCQLAFIPSGLTTLQISDTISFVGNDNLSQVPEKWFIGAHTVVLDNNYALSLPSQVSFPAGSTIPSVITIQNTSIEAIPSWIYDANISTVFAWNSPICAVNASRKVQQTSIECDYMDHSIGFDAWFALHKVGFQP